MLCSARLILQGPCNTLPAWNLASGMAPEAQAGAESISRLLEAESYGTSCSGIPKIQTKDTPALSLLLPWFLGRTKAGNGLGRACLAQGMSECCLAPLDTLSKGKIAVSEGRELSHRWAVPSHTFHTPLFVLTVPNCPLKAGKSLPAGLSLALQPFWSHFLHFLLRFLHFLFFSLNSLQCLHPREWALCAFPSGNTENPQHLLWGRMEE